MANIKISELNELTSSQVANNDVLPIVDVSTDETKKITVANIREGLSINVKNTYSTSQTDTYSCDYINNNDAYSTSEVKTNKRWIDGKPIYRKTFNTTTGSTANTWNSIGTISNVNRIVSCNYEIAIASSAKYINSYLDIYASSTNLNEQHTNDYYNDKTLYITIEYTKTTD